MKKFKLISTIILTLSLLLCLCTACGKTLLATPAEFSINDEYNLSWSPIANARSYVLRVTPVAVETSESTEPKEYSSRRAYYSLGNFAEGDYEINVKAVSGDDSYGDSEWSETFDFHKDYESGCIYTLINNDAEYEVTKVGSASGIVELGDVYRGKPVTSIADACFKGSGRIEKVVIGNYVKSIGENAFYNCTKLTEIVIPETVTSIGVGAFHNCNKLLSIKLPSGLTEIPQSMLETCMSLVSIDLPDVTTIGDYAFEGCSSLAEIVIPDTVTSLGEYAFAKCYSAEKLTIGSGVQTIGPNAFYKLSTLTEVNFAENSSLTTLGEGAFSSCSSLKKIALPDGVTDLGDKIFYGCTELTEVDLPDSLTHVGQETFNSTKLYAESMGDGQFVFADGWLVAWKGSSDSAVKAKLTQLKPDTLQEGVVGIADRVFANSLLISVDLPETVRVIGKSAFAYSKSLGRVYTYENNFTLEGSLELIDTYAFYSCTLLNRLFLNEGLKTIDNYAFYDCTNLVNNTTAGVSIIPSTVERIGTYAFNKTALYETATGVVYAGNWVVGYNGEDQSAIILNGLEGLNVRGISDYAFYQHDELKSISLASSSANTVRYIGRGAFYECTDLSAVSFSRVLEKIEPYTFYGCSSLFKISFPSRLTSIGRSAFYQCTNLDEIDLSESAVTFIGEYAFYNCMNLKKINLGSDLQTISSRAFYKNVSVQEVIVPDTVTTIGEYAFYQCTGLETLKLGESLMEISKSAFSGCAALTAVEIPDSVSELGDYAFYKCSAVSELKLGEGLKKIGDYAFAYASSVTNLYLPQSVESIGRYAFMRCSALTSVTLNADAVSSVGIHAFYGCSELTVYTDAGGLLPEWNAKWNSSFRPVVWNCELSDDGSYVISVTIGEGTVSNPNILNTVGSPKRDGYQFMGWTTESGSADAEYDSAALTELETGVTVYAVWTKISA